MGWWSCDVMGGDTPLDLQGDLYDALGVEQYPDDDSCTENELKPEHFTEEAVEKYIDDAVQQNDEEYLQLALQVLAYKGMEVGADISPWKYSITHAIITDEWAKPDEESRVIMSNFLGTVREYKGEPITLKSKGLFEVMAERLG